jgi:DNA polymerase-3 subunit delta'
VQIHGLADTMSRPGQQEKFKSFCDTLTWIIETIMKARAKGETLTAPLDSDPIMRLCNAYNLADWIKICENMQEHFNRNEYANLDKRYAILGVFSILSKQDVKKAA